MQTTYYPLHIIQDGYVLKSLRTFGLSYNLLLDRINSLATFLGVGKSSAYFFDASQDPATRTVFCTEEDTKTGWKPSYGVPQFVHYRIMTPNGMSNMREWIDQLRSIAGVTPFSWNWTPSETDYWAVSNGKADSSIQNRMGISARPILEMLFATGRIEYHPGERHAIRASCTISGEERNIQNPIWVEDSDYTSSWGSGIVGWGDLWKIWDFPDEFSSTLITCIDRARFVHYNKHQYISGDIDPWTGLRKKLTSIQRVSTGVAYDTNKYWQKFLYNSTETVEETVPDMVEARNEEIIEQRVEALVVYVDKQRTDSIVPRYDWVEKENLSHVFVKNKERAIIVSEDNSEVIFGASGGLVQVDGNYRAAINTHLFVEDYSIVNVDVPDEHLRAVRVYSGVSTGSGGYYGTIVGDVLGESSSTSPVLVDDNLGVNSYPPFEKKTDGIIVSSDTEPTTFADLYNGEENSEGRFVWIKPSCTLAEMWESTRNQEAVTGESSKAQMYSDGMEDVVKSLPDFVKARESEITEWPTPFLFTVNDEEYTVPSYAEEEEYATIDGDSNADINFDGSWLQGEMYTGDCSSIHNLAKSTAIWVYFDQFVYPSGYPESLNPSS